MKKTYTVALVLSSKLSESQVKDITGQVQNLYIDKKTKSLPWEIWPKRNLAYPIKKEKEAIYAYLTFSSEGVSSDTVNKIKMINGVLRLLLLKK
jgi:ribosomal protein S6